MANENLHKAKEAKNDEFYTQLNDVAEELRHYKDHFKDKVIFCNCDDPTSSAFWKYFHLNFEHLGLKKLIATHYDKEKPTYKMEYEGGDDNDIEIGIKTPLEGNGDFRNQECIDLLKKADIVVTNPPFSLFREYVNMLEEHNKKFLIIGNKNAITYKEFFPLLKDNKAWIGYSTPSEFDTPEGMTKKINGLCRWFTNLDIKKRHEKLILWKNYTSAEFPQYDNYDAINVDKVSNIPCDYCESWEVTEEEFKNFSAAEWEITRTGELNGKKSFFIIPAVNTELRKLLHEHTAGYKEEIEKEISKKIQKNIFIDDSKTGDLQDRRPARQVLQRRTGSPNYLLRQIQSFSIPDCRQRILTCSRQRPRIRSWKEDVQSNLHTEDFVTESLEYQSHSLTSTIQHSLKSLEQQSQKEKDSVTACGLQNQELHSLLLASSENISACLQERYCNGVTGVPITFLDKHNPEQFEIVKFRKGNDGKDLTYTKNELDSVQATGNRQQATGNRQQATGNRQQATGNRQQAPGNRQQATGNRQQATGNRQQATGNRQQATGHHSVLQDTYPKGIVTEPLALQLHTLTVTTPPSLKSSAWIDTSKIIQNMDIDSQSETKKNTQDLLSERYCNGIMGVPVTFLDKMGPNQFKIIGRADGNIKYDTPECYIPGFADKGGAPMINAKFLYKRILIQKKL